MQRTPSFLCPVLTWNDPVDKKKPRIKPKLDPKESFIGDSSLEEE